MNKTDVAFVAPTSDYKTGELAAAYLPLICRTGQTVPMPNVSVQQITYY